MSCTAQCAISETDCYSTEKSKNEFSINSPDHGSWITLACWTRDPPTGRLKSSPKKKLIGSSKSEGLNKWQCRCHKSRPIDELLLWSSSCSFGQPSTSLFLPVGENDELAQPACLEQS
mmetsp:Transcript_119269/g.187103  ORF Transcript_119269/g.187103 Transcript_119269/m.187103 type:complete len:118 (-) Transcript_119269:551-904(-)